MKKYNIIYADPPWHYSDVHSWKKMGGGILGKYNTMSVWEICALPVKKISDNNCILFLWATFPNLKDAFLVMEAWGFKYSTLGFSWIKLNKDDGKPFFGMGYWTRANCEICLLGTKGKPKRVDSSIPQLVVSNRREHSRKPDEVRSRIVQLCGDKSRIELFAREKHEGWDVWGDEAPNYEQKSLGSV